MIVLLEPSATPQAVKAIADRIREMGLEAIPLDDAKGRAFEVVGDQRGRVFALAGEEGVQEILSRRFPPKGAGEPLWPHFMLRVGILGVLLVSALLLLTVFLPPGLSDAVEKAGGPPAPVEWYLRPTEGLFRFLTGLPRWVGGTFVLVFGFVFLLLPWIDRGGESRRERLVALAIRTLGLAVLVTSVASILWVRS